MRADRCVCCGAVIPEGRQICPQCADETEDRMSVINGVWHDVQLDPPTEEGSYIVATDNGRVMIRIWHPQQEFCGKVVHDGWFSDTNCHVTHWMPCPAPPGGRKTKTEHVFRDRQKPEIRKRNMEIWELYQGGMKQAEIARKYKITPSTVHFILKDVERMKRHGLI